MHALIVFGSSFPFASLPHGQRFSPREIEQRGLESRQPFFLRKRERDSAKSCSVRLSLNSHF
jgi:hypothetical protein